MTLLPDCYGELYEMSDQKRKMYRPNCAWRKCSYFSRCSYVSRYFRNLKLGK